MISQRIIDAIAKQQDVFEAVHETQTTTIRSLHNDVLSTVEDEHANTRRQVVKETALLIKTEFALTHNVLQDIQVSLFSISGISTAEWLLKKADKYVTVDPTEYHDTSDYIGSSDVATLVC